MSSPFPPHLAEPNPFAVINRHIRQICLLREQGNIAEAEHVEQNEFANTLRDLRLAHGPQILPESELNALFEAEHKRVADAVILSELLIPQLVKTFSASPFPAQSRQVAASTATAPTASRDSSVQSSKAAAPAGVSPMITDLLDAMLASERGGRRPLSSPSA
jgi:hypothetical protein